MDCDMEYERIENIKSTLNGPPIYTDTETPLFFGNLSSFKQTQWPNIDQQKENFTLWNNQNSKFDHIIENKEPVKCAIDQNKNVKQSRSLFRMAKDFCGNIMQKHMPNNETGLDEITKQMASHWFHA